MRARRQLCRVTMVLVLLLAQLVGGANLMAQESELEGAWSAISAERDGAAALELVGHRIEFAGDRFRITRRGELLFGGRFTVGHGDLPAHIDFTIAEGPARGQGWAGIFRTGKGLLTICDNAPDPAASRPREFSAPKGSGHVCLTFAR